MQFYFIRHGKTKWNLEGRYQGGSGNSPLLPESYQDIYYLADHIKNTKFRAVYSSPLQRALETAVELEKQLGIKLPIITDDRLREFNLGKLEGMRFVDAEEQYPAQIKAFRFKPDQYDPSAFGGEKFQDMIARGTSLIKEISQKYPKAEDKVIIVSHGAALVALIQSLLGVNLAKIRKEGGLSNTSLTILESLDAGASFNKVVWNETSFLHKKLTETDTI